MNTFHVRHDFSPVFARNALLLLRMSDIPDEATFLEQARARDLAIGRRQSVTKVFASLRDLSLVESLSGQRSNLRLTSLGRLVADIAVRDELLFAELIHLRYWWLWSHQDSEARFAWSYQTVANMLWEEAPITIDADRLVTMVLTRAEQHFGTSDVSFSTSSVSGILYWLRALSPPCIVEKTFRRRPACPPESLIIALEGVAAATGCPLGIPIHLDTATRERVCRATLLEVEAFDEVLSQAEETLRVIRRRGGGSDTMLIREPLFLELIPQRLR